MEFALVFPPLIALLGAIFFAALVASIVPVAQVRLPWILRGARFPLVNERDPNVVALATSVISGTGSIRAYRVGLCAIVALTLAAQVRSATSAELNAALGTQPLVVCVIDLAGMLTWSAYVVVRYRRAAAPAS